nr:uncharacterized protein LOC129257884 [Lytechinus pictus]
MDTDDEEVVLKGSPLYQYLKEACPDDGFQCFQSTAGVEGAISPGKQRRGLTKRLRDVCKVIQVGITKLTHGIVFPVDRQEFLAYLNNHHLPKFYTLAMRSRCLNEDDAAVLSTLLGVSDKPKQSGAKIIFWLIILGLLMISHTMFLSGVCHPKLLLNAVEAFNALDILVYAVVMTILFLSLMWQVGVLWQYFRLWSTHRRQDKCFDKFLSSQNSFGRFLKKSVLYVQEVEVILRGYTMMTPFTPISHLERGSQTQLQCPALRQAIFQAARNQFMSLRQAMLSTIDDAQLREEEHRDLEDLYLATTDLQRLAGDLSILTDDSTGPYPTSYLKAISNLYSDQLSEFIRRYLLCLKPDLLADPSGDTSSSHSTLDNVTRLAGRDLATLKNSYKLHQPMSPLPSDMDPQNKACETGEIWGPSNILPSAARALRLHLDVTMKRAMQIESRTCTEEGKYDFRDSEIHKLDELLSEVKGHLEACQTCLHEAETALAKLAGHMEPANQKEPVMLKTETKADLPTPQQLDFISPKDNDIDFIEEEIFEAYIDPDRDDGIPDYSMDDLIEERRKRKQDSEDAKHMLVELHSVLSKREEEKEKMRREKRRIREGDDSAEEWKPRGDMNGGEVDSMKDDERTNNPVTDADLSHDLESGNRLDGSMDVENKRTSSHERQEDSKIHTGKDKSKHGANEIGDSEESVSIAKVLEVGDDEDDSRKLNHNSGDSISGTNLLPVTDKGDGRDSDGYDHINNQYLCHQIPDNVVQDVRTSGGGEGYDASGIGRSTEKSIRRPVPKPRKNIGKRLNPLTHGNTAHLTSGACQVTSDNGRAPVRAEESACTPQEDGKRDSGEERGLEREDGEGASPWRPQPMAIPFMQGLAAEAVRISRGRQSLAEDTFGD